MTKNLNVVKTDIWVFAGGSSILISKEPCIHVTNTWKMQRSLTCLHVMTRELLPVSVDGGQLGSDVLTAANVFSCRKWNIGQDIQILISPNKTRFERGGKKGGIFQSKLWSVVAIWHRWTFDFTNATLQLTLQPIKVCFTAMVPTFGRFWLWITWWASWWPHFIVITTVFVFPSHH